MGNSNVKTPPDKKATDQPDADTGLPKDIQDVYTQSLREFDALYAALAQ